MGLVYGYIPFFILPLYAALDRIDGRYLEAARDLGASAKATFLRVTLPLSVPGILAASVITALPMFGDYYTNTILSGSPGTEMIGNQIELYITRTQPAAERRRAGAHPLGPAARADELLPRHHHPRPEVSGVSQRRSLDQAAGPARHHVAVRRLVDRAGAHRHRLLVQQRPQPLDVAGLLGALVVDGRRARWPRTTACSWPCATACCSGSSPSSSSCRSACSWPSASTRWRSPARPRGEPRSRSSRW